MADLLSELETKIAKSDIFGGKEKEKQEELVDAIYMSALRTNTDLSKVVEVIRTKKAFKTEFFQAKCGNVFSFVDKEFRSCAKRLFIKRAGGGTPNAAMGKGELLLLLLSDETKKPVRGDIDFNGRRIEVKTNGGKLGLGTGEQANKKVVAFCKKQKIDLRKGETGVAAKGLPAFNPAMEKDRKLVGVRLGEVLQVWWKEISGESLLNPTWPNVRKEFLKKCWKQHIKANKLELLIFDGHGNFRFFHTQSEFVRYYDKEVSRFECRAYQKNPFAIYLDIFEGTPA